MSTATNPRNPFWPDVTSEAGPKTRFALTIAQNAIQQHDDALSSLKSQVDAVSASLSSSSAGSTSATTATASAATIAMTPRRGDFSVLPVGAPAGWLQISIQGGTFKIPYYAV